jgi:hypothetical protein
VKTSLFVKTVPSLAKPHLPKNLRAFKQTLLPWLVQLYYDDRLLHYELAKLPEKYGANRLEIGLHCESRDRELNTALLEGFDRYLLEIRDKLNADWWAEPWDRGWTKVYTTLVYDDLTEELAESVALQLAQAITVIHPIYTRLRSRQKG